MLYCPRSKEWFENRIGRKIYRNKIESDSDFVVSGNTDGFVVYNTIHAQRLSAIDAEYASEGIYLNYRDEK
jgi:nitrous oxidase accessory protein NosD